MIEISVILPTYKPNSSTFSRTLNALREQTIDPQKWELIIICNGQETEKMVNNFAIDWKNECHVVLEEEIGLTRARITGINKSVGNLLVFVDDDNFLESDYLSNAFDLSRQYPAVHTFGGRSQGEFEVEPPSWVTEFEEMLAIRDFGDQPIVSSLNGRISEYPRHSPVGAGMVLRKSSASHYVDTDCEGVVIGDRTGESLSSGGDNDIVCSVLFNGGEVGYFPELLLTHFIPAHRISKSYMCRLHYSISRSWVRVLAKYDICPWSKTDRTLTGIRKVIAYLKRKAWKSTSDYIRWCSSCGHIDGQADL